MAACGRVEFYWVEQYSKTCSKCGEVKALEEFYKSKGGKFGRCSECKVCTLERISTYRLQTKGVVKKCSSCGEESDNFSSGRGICKACYASLCREAHAANPEKRRAAGKAWRDANPDKCKDKARARYLADPEKLRAFSKKHREAHPEKARERTAEWKKANREKLNARTRLLRSLNPDKFKAYSKTWRMANPEKYARILARANLKQILNGATPPEELVLLKQQQYLINKELKNAKHQRTEK